MTEFEFGLALYFLPLIFVSVVLCLVNMITKDPRRKIPDSSIAFFSLIPIVNIIVAGAIVMITFFVILYTLAAFLFGKQK